MYYIESNLSDRILYRREKDLIEAFKLSLKMARGEAECNNVVEIKTGIVIKKD